MRLATADVGGGKGRERGRDIHVKSSTTERCFESRCCDNSFHAGNRFGMALADAFEFELTKEKNIKLVGATLRLRMQTAHIMPKSAGPSGQRE